jgi:hypothetical protein
MTVVARFRHADGSNSEIRVDTDAPPDPTAEFRSVIVPTRADQYTIPDNPDACLENAMLHAVGQWPHQPRHIERYLRIYWNVTGFAHVNSADGRVTYLAAISRQDGIDDNTANAIAANEVETYRAWADGEVYAVTVHTPSSSADCYGFYGFTDTKALAEYVTGSPVTKKW